MNSRIVIEESEYDEARMMTNDNGDTRTLYYHLVPIMHNDLKLYDIYIDGKNEPEELIFREDLENNEWTMQHRYTMCVNTPKKLKLFYK